MLKDNWPDYEKKWICEERGKKVDSIGNYMSSSQTWCIWGEYSVAFLRGKMMNPRVGKFQKLETM